MTYQEILEAFDSKRAVNLDMPTGIRIAMDSDNIQCTLRELLVKLSHGDKE